VCWIRLENVYYVHYFVFLTIRFDFSIEVRGGGAQWAEFWISCSHLSIFQVNSLIISSLMLHQLSIIGISFLFLIPFTTFRIMKFSWWKSWPIVSGTEVQCATGWHTVPRYSGPLGGTQQIYWVAHNKYIETLLIWLHLIFIYLIYTYVNN